MTCPSVLLCRLPGDTDEFEVGYHIPGFPQQSPQQSGTPGRSQPRQARIRLRGAGSFFITLFPCQRVIASKELLDPLAHINLPSAAARRDLMPLCLATVLTSLKHLLLVKGKLIMITGECVRFPPARADGRPGRCHLSLYTTSVNQRNNFNKKFLHEITSLQSETASAFCVCVLRLGAVFAFLLLFFFFF